VNPSESDAQQIPGVEAFQTPTKVTITTNNPLLLGVLNVLADAAPSVMSYADLERLVRARLSTSSDTGAQELATQPGGIVDTILQCAPNGLVEFRSLPSRFVVRPSVRPKASGLARWQGNYTESVTSLGHWSMPLSGMERFLLQHLDGTNDRAQLVRLTERALAEGDLTISAATPSRADLADIVDEVLDRIGRAGLLVS
jgi:hypothetical protein